MLSSTMKCRHCGAPVTHTLADLGSAPPSNAYLSAQALHGPERWYPLRVLGGDRLRVVDLLVPEQEART